MYVGPGSLTSKQSLGNPRVENLGPFGIQQQWSLALSKQVFTRGVPQFQLSREEQGRKTLNALTDTNPTLIRHYFSVGLVRIIVGS
jgi:hypothetical protein